MPMSRRAWRAWLLSTVVAAAPGVAEGAARGVRGDLQVYLSADYHRIPTSPWAQRLRTVGLDLSRGSAIAPSGGVAVGLTRRVLVGIGAMAFAVGDRIDGEESLAAHYRVRSAELSAQLAMMDGRRLLLTALAGGGLAVVDDERHLEGLLEAHGRRRLWSRVVGARAVLRGLRSVSLDNLAASVDLRYRWLPVAHDVPEHFGTSRQIFQAGGWFAAAGLTYCWPDLLR